MIPPFTVYRDQPSGTVIYAQDSAAACCVPGGNGWGEFLAWNAAQPTPDPLTAQPDPNYAASQLALLRDAAVGLITDSMPHCKFIRGVLFAQGDYANQLQGWIAAFTATTAAATSLNDFKSRVAALTVPPAITVANAKTAVQNKISGGAAD